MERSNSDSMILHGIFCVRGVFFEMSESICVREELVDLVSGSETVLGKSLRHIFYQKSSTELTFILRTPSMNSLSYHKLENRCLDKKLIRYDALSQEEMWRRNGPSADEQDIQFRQ